MELALNFYISVNAKNVFKTNAKFTKKYFLNEKAEANKHSEIKAAWDFQQRLPPMIGYALKHSS